MIYPSAKPSEAYQVSSLVTYVLAGKSLTQQLLTELIVRP